MTLEIISRIETKVDKVLSLVDGQQKVSPLIQRIERIEGSLYSGSGAGIIISSASIAQILQSTNFVTGSAGWRINKDGNVELNNLVARGTMSSFNYSAGSAGWIINSNGDAEFNSITARGTLQSDNYTAGVQGWKITNTGQAEFQEVIVRGEIRSSVFTTDEISAIDGRQIISKGAGVLSSDVTTVTSPTTFSVDIKDPTSGHPGAAPWAVNDILRIKYAAADNWLKITATSNQTTFWRYTCTLENGTAATWREGTAVVNYGPSTFGAIMLTAADTNAPYINIFTHAGSPWSTISEKVRLGNLNGSFGLSEDVYGLGVGDFSGGNYLLFNSAVPEFRMVSASGNMVADSEGLTFAVGTADQNKIRWVDSSNTHGSINVFDDADENHVAFRIKADPTGLRDFGSLFMETGSGLKFELNESTTNSKVHAYFDGDDEDLTQFDIGQFAGGTSTGFVSLVLRGKFKSGFGDGSEILLHDGLDYFNLGSWNDTGNQAKNAFRIVGRDNSASTVEELARFRLNRTHSIGGLFSDSQLTIARDDPSSSASDVTLDVNGKVWAGKDVDGEHYFGRVRLGTGGTTDNAVFSHHDQGGSTTAFALRQLANGETRVNSTTTVYLQTGGVTDFDVNGNGMRLAGEGERIDQFINGADVFPNTGFVDTKLWTEKAIMEYCLGLPSRDHARLGTSTTVTATATWTAIGNCSITTLSPSGGHLIVGVVAARHTPNAGVLPNWQARITRGGTAILTAGHLLGQTTGVAMTAPIVIVWASVGGQSSATYALEIIMNTAGTLLVSDSNIRNSHFHVMRMAGGAETTS